MEIKIDQRIELITIIQTICGYWDNLAKIFNDSKLFQCEYKENINQYFDKYKQHETINIFKELSDIEQGISTFLILILNYSDPPDLIKIGNNDENKYEHFINSIRKFYQETKFSNFYENNKYIYDKMLSDFGNKENILMEVSRIFEYFDIENKNYKVIISPLVMGNFGIHINKSNYIILSPFDYKDNKYIFGSKEYLRQTIWHEIGHTVINDLTKKYYDLSEHKNMEVPQIFVKQFYNNTETIINEYIIRSIVYLLENDKNSKKNILEYEKNTGFTEIKNIGNYILKNNMEDNRFIKDKKYKKLIDFVFKII